METKPFSLQAPEDIAKEYGGNKQKIAQAMQMGLVDPTAGLIAGMFIDRIRSAATAEQGPPQTLAQEVFTPPQPQPPQGGMPPAMPGAMPPEMMPPAGLAALPPQAPPAAPAGLEGLPVPDAMFDSQPGGLLEQPEPQFDRGGRVRGDDLFERWARATIQQESGGDYKARNTKSGAMGKYQFMPDTARGMAQKLGLPYRPEWLLSDTPEAQQYQDTLGSAFQRELWERAGGDPSRASTEYYGGPNPKKWGPNTRQYTSEVLARMGRFGQDEPLEEVDMRNREGRRVSFSENLDAVRSYMTGLPDESRKALDAYWAQQADPEKLKKDKKQDMWSALAQLGFGMAASDSPYFLQAVGQSASATLPQMREDKKAREDKEFKAMSGRAGLEGQRRSEAIQELGIASDLTGHDRDAEFKEYALDSTERVAKAEMETKLTLGQLDADTRLKVANIQAAAAKAGNARDPKTIEVLAETVILPSLLAGVKQGKKNPATTAPGGGYYDISVIRRKAYEQAAVILGMGDKNTNTGLPVPGSRLDPGARGGGGGNANAFSGYKLEGVEE